MLPDALFDGMRWVLVIVFILAAAEKGSALRHRSAAWHPVMLAHSRLRPHARALMTVAVAADALTVVLLVIAPRAGAATAAALVLAYSAFAAGLHSEVRGPAASCRCLWKVLDTATPVTFAARNLLLIGLAAGVALTPPGATTHASAGYGALILAVLVLGIFSLERISQTPTPVSQGGSQL